MSSLNKAILIGNLGKDPETRFTPSGKAVCSFSIATSEKWKDKSTGEMVDKVEWHNITTFDKLADICNQHLKKGSSVYIEGRITTEKWQDKEGKDRYTTKIVANEMKMLGGLRDKTNPPDKEANQAATKQNTAGFDDFEDGLPFN